MFFIPGQLITLVTFPGVIAHEFAHEFFCRKFGVIVYEVRYFIPFGNPAGYVLHGKTENYKQAFWISVGPFVINTFIAVLLAAPAVIKLIYLEVFKLTPVDAWLLWIGVSCGMNAFPSKTDADNLIKETDKACKNKNFWAPLGYPVAGLLHLLNVGSVLWLDLIFAIAVIYLVPKFIIMFLSNYLF